MNTSNKESYAGYRMITDDVSLAYYLKEIGKYKSLPLEEEAKLAMRIRNGDAAALDKLIKSNLRFVVSVSRNYQNQGLPLVDLINEGNLGLIRAAKRFDETKNFKFISYAVWWIRQAILQALAEQSRIVKLPLNRVGVVHKIGVAQSKLEQKYGRNPNINEIADELKINSSDVHEAIKIGNTHFSLDAPLQNSEDSKMLDLLRDDRIEAPDANVMNSSQMSQLDFALEKLLKREREVIKLYYGIGEDMAYTLEEIGVKLNLTRERVRQIKEQALKNLKKEQCIKNLKKGNGNVASNSLKSKTNRRQRERERSTH